MSDVPDEIHGTEADWRADLRTLLAEWKTSPRVEWLRLHRLEQGNRCHYCTAVFAEKTEDPLLAPTLDHVIPKSEGGEHSFANTVAACWLCNTAKQSMMPDEAALHLPHQRVALLNEIERRRARSRKQLKRKRKRARARARAACADKASEGSS